MNSIWLSWLLCVANITECNCHPFHILECLVYSALNLLSPSRHSYDIYPNIGCAGWTRKPFSYQNKRPRGGRREWVRRAPSNSGNTITNEWLQEVGEWWIDLFFLLYFHFYIPFRVWIIPKCLLFRFVVWDTHIYFHAFPQFLSFERKTNNYINYGHYSFGHNPSSNSFDSSPVCPNNLFRCSVPMLPRLKPSCQKSREVGKLMIYGSKCRHSVVLRLKSHYPVISNPPRRRK